MISSTMESGRSTESRVDPSERGKRTAERVCAAPRFHGERGTAGLLEMAARLGTSSAAALAAGTCPRAHARIAIPAGGRSTRTVTLPSRRSIGTV